MSGKKGMYHQNPDSKTVRKMVWKSMRIMRNFTIPDLLRTAPGSTYGNVRKFLQGLTRHGIVTKIGTYTGGRIGDYQKFHLNKTRADVTGPKYPTVCELCGQPLTAKICDPEKKKEK
jgi:hypothetical protein